MQTSIDRQALQNWSGQSPTSDPQQRIFAAVYTVTTSPCVNAALWALPEEDGTAVARFASAQQFLEHTRTDDSSCLILDVPRNGSEEMELHCQLAAKACPPVIFVCGHNDIGSAVRAMKAGAIELLTVPVAPSALLEAIQLALAQDRRLR